MGGAARLFGRDARPALVFIYNRKTDYYRYCRLTTVLSICAAGDLSPPIYVALLAMKLASRGARPSHTRLGGIVDYLDNHTAQPVQYGPALDQPDGSGGGARRRGGARPAAAVARPA